MYFLGVNSHWNLMLMSQMVSDTTLIIVHDSLSLLLIMCGNFKFVCIKTSFCYKKHLITLDMSE